MSGKLVELPETGEEDGPREIKGPLRLPSQRHDAHGEA
jgi:hypothetical protein